MNNSDVGPICSGLIFFAGGETYSTRDHVDTSRGLSSGRLGPHAFLLENRSSRPNSFHRHLCSSKESP